uniref:Uncharacterized protein n=1 Tax=Arundo donax TaxID=35708 RepID=A0A0A8Z2C0_ARUDO
MILDTSLGGVDTSSVTLLLLQQKPLSVSPPSLSVIFEPVVI